MMKRGFTMTATHTNPMHSRCGLEDCDCGYVIEKLVLALEHARDVVHRTHCPTPPSLPQKCWKECEEAMDAMLEAGWTPPLPPREERRW